MKASCNLLLTPGGPRPESQGEIILRGRGFSLSTHLVTIITCELIWAKDTKLKEIKLS
jgi:hypothetical protein